MDWVRSIFGVSSPSRKTDCILQVLLPSMLRMLAQRPREEEALGSPLGDTVLATPGCFVGGSSPLTPHSVTLRSTS